MSTKLSAVWVGALLALGGCGSDLDSSAASLKQGVHSWGGYHWARTANPFTLKVGDNLTQTWKPYLSTTATDWTQSSVLDLTIVPGLATGRKCRAISGRDEICNAPYGRNGWLGIATIYLRGGHIVAGTVRLNDTYFGSGSSYDSPAWRNLVMCQEVGHTLGLDHQDENFSNNSLGTCMDYSNDPNPNQHPNAHDYEQLELIYQHPDSSTTVASLPPAVANAEVTARADWGHPIDERTFVRDLGDGWTITTHVIWAEADGRERGAP